MFARHRLFQVLAALVVLMALMIGPAGAAHAAGTSRYAVRPAHTLYYLNVEGGSTADGARIIQWYEASGTVHPNESWYFDAVPGTSDTFYIRSYSDDKVISVNSFVAGAPAIQWANQGAPSQQWQRVPFSGGSYKFRNVATGLYLDVSGYSYASGAKLVQWYATSGLNQQFYLDGTV